MLVKPASSEYPELFTVKLWIIVPPCPIVPLNVSVTIVGVGPVIPLLLEPLLFVQPNDAAAASMPSANMNWRMFAAEQKPDRSVMFLELRYPIRSASIAALSPRCHNFVQILCQRWSTPRAICE
jgi:hypothetical protein